MIPSMTAKYIIYISLTYPSSLYGTTGEGVVYIVCYLVWSYCTIR